MAASSEPLVSILTPVYNGEEFLAECIESVLAQNYSNWEYIIVNNCSTDGTQTVAERYARTDKRIRVYQNDRLLDIISNHNRAFRLISPASKYCKVVSADDWIFPECISRMVGVAEANPSVGIVGSYQLSGGGSDGRNWRVRWAEVPYPSTVIPGGDACRSRLLGGPYVFGSPTSILYRSDLVRGQEYFYPNGTAEADTSACFKYLAESDFGFVHQVLSYERIHSSQTSAGGRSVNSYEPSRLCDLTKYGPLYLTEAELTGRREHILRNYYNFLAASFLENHRDLPIYRFGREKAFWDYHKRRLADAGYPLSHVRLAKCVAKKLLSLLLSPIQALEKVFRRKLIDTDWSGAGS